jgi:hypothetical protein
MKLVTLAIAFLSITPAFAQSNLKPTAADDLSITPGSTSQAGCPVAFTDVSLETKAHFMPVRQDTAPDGNLRFQYKNQSGKEIQSISVRAELKVKKSVYDLDATTITLNMTLTGKSAEETMPLTLRAYGLSRITLEQVSFTDGTIWNADIKNTCSYERMNGSEQIGKLQ